MRPRQLLALGPLLLAGGTLLVLGARGQEDAPAAPGPAARARAAIEAVGRSVVRVEVEGGRARGDAPRWRFFRNVATRDAGAGLVVGERLVLTHGTLALRDGARYVITAPSGVRTTAELHVLDLERELALLQAVEALDAPIAPLATSQHLRPGHLVIALGDPFGAARDARAAATQGIVEGRLRLDALEAGFAGEVLLTDAAINPGTEGGPLVDLAGRVVGVLAPLARDRRVDHLAGYAIPVEAARAVLARAEEGERLELGFLGRPSPGGVAIYLVRANSPAARIGLRPGDVLVAIDGAPVRSGADVRSAMAGGRAGGALFEVERDGERLRLRWAPR